MDTMTEIKWTERVQTGEEVGRDPRKMTPEEFEGLGHVRMTATEAIRARCLDCCAGSPQEVRYCTARKCPSWPWRMGKNPWIEKREMSEENKAAARARLAEASKKRRIVVPD
jgi:hypothetical protein